MKIKEEEEKVDDPQEEEIIEPLNKLLEDTKKYKASIVQKQEDHQEALELEEVENDGTNQEKDDVLNKDLQNILENNLNNFKGYDNIDSKSESEENPNNDNSNKEQEHKIICDEDNNNKEINKKIDNNKNNQKKKIICDENNNEKIENKNNDEDEENEEMINFFLKHQKQKDNNRYFDDISNKVCHKCHEKGHVASLCLKNVVVNFIINRHVTFVLEIIEEKNVNQWFVSNVENKDI